MKVALYFMVSIKSVNAGIEDGGYVGGPTCSCTQLGHLADFLEKKK